MAAKAAPLLALLPLCLTAAAPAAAQQVGITPAPVPAQPQLVVAAPAPVPDHPGAILLPRDTMVRLMVLYEVGTRQAKPGDRFVLRVDEDVTLGGAILVPTGAKAWAEVTEVKGNQALGKPGELGARLLYLEAGSERIALTGEERSTGNKGGDRVVAAIAGFGVFGLLARGNQGKLKAGHIFNGYVAEDRLFDPASGKFIAAPITAPVAAPAAPAP
jgi:hypothetical protein